MFGKMYTMIVRELGSHSKEDNIDNDGTRVAKEEYHHNVQHKRCLMVDTWWTSNMNLDLDLEVSIGKREASVMESQRGRWRVAKNLRHEAKKI